MNRVSLWLSNRVLYRDVKVSLDEVDNKLDFEITTVIKLLDRLLVNDLSEFNRRLHEYPIRVNFNNYDRLLSYLNELLTIISNGTYKNSKLKYSGSRQSTIDDFFTDDEDNLVSVVGGLTEIRYILKNINKQLLNTTGVKREYYGRILYPVAYTVLHITSSLTGYIYDK